MAWLAFAIFLFIACAALIIAEVFVPSGGLLSIVATACLVGGIAVFFYYSPTAGWIGVVVAVVMIPTLLVLAYKIFPKTRFGKSVTLAPPKRPKGDAVADSSQLAELIGAEGRVLTPLRPVGTCDFSGRRVECVAESGYVDTDERVRVIRVESTQVTVRTVEQG